MMARAVRTGSSTSQPAASAWVALTSRRLRVRCMIREVEMARIKAAPKKMFVIQMSAPANCRPWIPVPSKRIATSVPHTLKRPGLICVVPRKAAESAGSRYSGPADWLTLFSEDASRTPQLQQSCCS